MNAAADYGMLIMSLVVVLLLVANAITRQSTHGSWAIWMFAALLWATVAFASFYH